MVYILPVYDKNIFLHYTKNNQYTGWRRYQQPSLHTHLLLANQHSIYGTYATHSFFLHCKYSFFTGQALKRTKITNIANPCIKVSSGWFYPLFHLPHFFFRWDTPVTIQHCPKYKIFHLLGFTGSCMILGIGFILNQITSTIKFIMYQ